MILDVGCGHQPHGDVNADLFMGATLHRRIDDRPLNKERIKNFVCCDAHFLPFKKGIFREVYSRHIIEHVQNPIKVLKEMLRVSNHQVIIICPHRYANRAKIKMHKHIFNLHWFKRTCEKLGYYCKGENTSWRCFPHTILPLFQLPSEIKITIFKGKGEKRARALGSC